MNEVFAIITACGLLNLQIDCIRMQQQEAPVPQYQCIAELNELALYFEEMRIKLPQFKDYIIVEQRCSKESMKDGNKPREKSI